MKKVTKTEYERYLNDVGCPDHDKQSNGGRCSDNARYGAWLRRNDPVAFHVGFNEYRNNSDRLTNARSL